MSFMNSYKHLEKLCGEIMRDERRVSAYIDEMTCTPFGPSLVAGWNNDLKKLKYYRHIRNLIAHEPDCSEDSLCYLRPNAFLLHCGAQYLSSNPPPCHRTRNTYPRSYPVHRCHHQYMNRRKGPDMSGKSIPSSCTPNRTI